MAARDTFEWFVTTQAGERSAVVEAFIREQRQYLFTLRSEDERQRFVESILARIAQMARTGAAMKEARPSSGPVGK